MVRGTQSERQRRESRRQNEERDENMEEEGGVEGEERVKGLKNPIKTAQHLFLQSFMSKRIMPMNLASNLFDKCNQLCGVEDAGIFSTFRNDLNDTLEIVGMQFKEGKDFETGQNILALVNTNSDEASKLATDYKPEEIALFRVLINKIMTAPKLSYSVGMTDALRCVSDPSVTPQISKTLAAGLFASFAAKGWLQYHTSKRLTFSSRTLLELSNYLRNTFDINKNNDEDDDEDEVDLPPHQRIYVECKVCMTLVTSGWACPNEDCVVRLHKHCAVGALGARGKCPGQGEGCNEIWMLQDGTFVGLLVGLAAGDQSVDLGAEEESDEEEVEDDQETSTGQKKGGRRSSSTVSASTKKGKGKSSSKKQKIQDDEEEDELDEDQEDDDDEAEGDGSPVARREKSSRNSAATAKSKMIIDEAEGEDSDLYE